MSHEIAIPLIFHPLKPEGHFGVMSSAFGEKGLSGEEMAGFDGYTGAPHPSSPGKVPGSKAIYEKIVDSQGRTIGYTKTTYDQYGNVVHIKDKIGED